MIAKSLLHLVSTNTIAADNFLAGMKDILELAPDLHIDIPMLYDYLGKFLAPQIEKKVHQNCCLEITIYFQIILMILFYIIEQSYLRVLKIFS